MKSNIQLNKEYWDNFYKSNHKHTPSQFCVYVLTDINSESIVVELGCGNGRDSHYFASQGHYTVAIDMSSQAILSCKELAKTRNISHVEFIRGDLSCKDDMEKLVQRARDKSANNKLVFYSRFVTHSLDDEQEKLFLDNLSNLMLTNEIVYLEFRSQQDATQNKLYGDHYRRYIDTDNFVNNLKNNLGYSIDYAITGQGMAKYKNEDPFVSRVIARKIQ